ncbi:Beta-taxilin [Dissostichus eleginoides]|uniref:Beta-taxilin n=1 Tax=Dissostichus eleginoides TaxID=100907 RepID=A0AAD9FAF6_DISEL|nr:Beta-taxilin [Dissostichus eleginoides]
MEACLAPGCPDLDLTEDLAQQLEDIISTYQEEESPPDQNQEEGEEVPPTKETPGSRKEQKLEKKMLKNLGKEAMLLMQSLNKLNTPEQKLEAIIKKHAELLEEHRGEQKQLKMLQKKLLQVMKDKDQLQSEHSRAVLARSKLEGLCRELQRHNKTLKNLEKVFKHRDLKQKLVETKLTQSNVILKETEDKHKLERELLMTQMAAFKSKVKTMKEQEGEMKIQLAMYSEKFDEFQGTVSKSNSVYSGFKLDMDKMAKKMKKLDKECQSWKSRFDNCNKGLVEMVNDKSIKEKEFDLVLVKNQKLENLCRALQEERRSSSVKVQEAGSAPQSTEKETSQEVQKVQEEVQKQEVQKQEVQKQEVQKQEAESLPAETLLSKERNKLKAEQSRLQEIFLISHTIPTETDSQSQELPEEEEAGLREEEEQKKEEEGQVQRDLEMQSVD